MKYVHSEDLDYSTLVLGLTTDLFLNNKNEIIFTNDTINMSSIVDVNEKFSYINPIHLTLNNSNYTLAFLGVCNNHIIYEILRHDNGSKSEKHYRYEELNNFDTTFKELIDMYLGGELYKYHSKFQYRITFDFNNRVLRKLDFFKKPLKVYSIDTYYIIFSENNPIPSAVHMFDNPLHTKYILEECNIEIVENVHGENNLVKTEQGWSIITENIIVTEVLGYIYIMHPQYFKYRNNECDDFILKDLVPFVK